VPVDVAVGVEVAVAVGVFVGVGDTPAHGAVVIEFRGIGGDTTSKSLLLLLVSWQPLFFRTAP
jgi:hypothetical protein